MILAVLGRLFESANRLADPARQVGQLPRPEDQQDNHENDHEFGEADSSHKQIVRAWIGADIREP